MKTRNTLKGIFWIALYVVFSLAPLSLMLFGERPMGREFWREFSVALGFVGIAMTTLQFVLTARIAAIKSPYGSDVVYYFHHHISLVTFALWLAHPLILFIQFPGTRQLLNLITAPWRARAGVTSVIVLIALIVISVWRRQLKIEYVRWRIWHGILATLALILVMVHIYLVGRYVGTPFKQALWLGYGGICVLLVAYVRVINPYLISRRPYEVVEVRPERGAVWSLALRPVGHQGMRFQPGQFAWLTAWNSAFSDREHPFSFSSSAENPEQVEFAIKELGDFTSTIKDLKPGQHVYLDGPYGAFSVDRQAKAQEIVLIAGGIGISPIMSTLRTLAERGDGRPLLLIYGNRTWEEVSFREELELLQEHLDLRVVHVLEKPPKGWEGEVGFVTAEMLDRYLPADRRRVEAVFVCGPPPMMNAVEAALLKLDVPLRAIHMERFDLA